MDHSGKCTRYLGVSGAASAAHGGWKPAQFDDPPFSGSVVDEPIPPPVLEEDFLEAARTSAELPSHVVLQ